MKLLSVFYTVFVLLFVVAPLCATTKASEQRPQLDPAVQKDLNKRLIRASCNGVLLEVEQLLAQGANVNSANGKGFTPLCMAVRKGCVEMARLLIGAGADVNLATNQGFTPLHIAAFEDHEEIVNLLINAEANVNSVAKEGRTPLVTAILHGGRIDMVKQLIGIGASTGAPHFLNTIQGRIRKDPGIRNIFESINRFFESSAVTLEILEQLPPQEKWQEIILLLGVSILRGREDLVAMLMQAAPEFKSALQKQAYAVAKRLRRYSIANKTASLRGICGAQFIKTLS
jgi:hypothetical protein